MLQMNYGSITVLYLCVLSGAIMGQAGAPKPPPASAVLASSGSFQLTEQMIDQALRFGQILAGADFSPSDAAAMRSGLIATFRKEPVKETADYESVAKILKQTAGRKASWLDLALIRYKVWQSYGENQQAFRDLQSSPFGKMVLKYNPVLVNSGGMVVSKTDVDCHYFSDALVASCRGGAAHRGGKRPVCKKSSIPVCVLAKRAAGVFETRRASSGGLLHSVRGDHQDARHRRRRYPEKRPLFRGRLAGSPPGGERRPVRGQVLPTLSQRSIDRRPRRHRG